jgi:glycerol-3-phosphate dehydrogenase subunit C
MVCPTGVKIAEINARARANMVAQGKTPFHLRIRNNLVARPEILGKIARPVSPIANFLLNSHPARKFAEYALGIHHSAPLPRFTAQTFREWFNKHHSRGNLYRKAVYFHGCSTQYYEPRIGKAAVQVLEANGFEVIVPDQNCCGLPLLSNGEFKAARRYHENNVKHLIQYVREGIPIVGTSTSCTLTIKEEAPELLNMDDAETQLVARNTYDINEFLLLIKHEETLNLELKPINLVVGYHVPCQYRAHRIGKPGIELLKLIPGLEIIDSNLACCGIAGTYGYKREKYQVAMDIGRPLFSFFNQEVSNSPFVVCDSETCRWQITHGTGKSAIHPIELLAKAYGLPVEGAVAYIP